MAEDDDAFDLLDTPFTLEVVATFESLTPPDGTATTSWVTPQNNLLVHRSMTDEANPDGWDFVLYEDGRLALTHGGGGDSGTYVETAADAVRAGRWVHLAATFDGAAYRLWVDGALVAEAAGAAPTDAGTPDELIVGSFGDEDLYYAARFQIAAARISTTERYTDAFTPADRLDVDADTLVQWAFGADGASDVVRDQSGHGHDGAGTATALVEAGPACAEDDTGSAEDTGSSGEPDPGTNLLVNPGLETGDFTGWSLELEGGDGWAVKPTGLTGTEFGDYAARTSYELCARQQTVDLVAAGYSADYLDTAPYINVSDWFRERYDVDGYFGQVELLDEDGRVLSTWSELGATTGDATCTDDAYFEVSHSFTGYGAGVRFVAFTDGRPLRKG